MKKWIPLLFFAVAAARAQSLDTVLAAIETPEKVYRITETETKPEPANGMFTLTRFISTNFKIPAISNKKLTVFVSFIVEKDGSLSDLHFVHYLAEALYEDKFANGNDPSDAAYEAAQLNLIEPEAVRVLTLFPDIWKPATIKDVPVRCFYNLPIVFNIE
ncbi:MAG TPA: hypothetical protein VF581_06305 [Flavobacterium sp.]|jgi:hypothetical protein